MKYVWQSLRMLLALSILTGLMYPLVMTGLAHVLFEAKANGSIITANGKLVGSDLVGQAFTSERYFWSRPSAIGYNSLPSAGTNAGPTSATLRDSVQSRAARLSSAISEIPADLLLASGSGLDPHISPEAARFQFNRILTARAWSPGRRVDLERLVQTHMELRQFGVFGQPRVNVLRLNMALDYL